MILVKLNQGESLNPPLLAQEFGVNLRTIQRDLNVRFSYLPLEKIDGLYRLDTVYLGKLNTRDIDNFARLSGIQGLFPSLSDEFLGELFDSRVQAALLVRGHDYEALHARQSDFLGLERAIVERNVVGFRYEKSDGTAHHREAEPYKLLNQKGIWYLVAKEAGKVKTFAFTRIQNLILLDRTFKPDAGVDRLLATEEGIWFSGTPVEVVLHVDHHIASYFKRRKLIANQVIDQELGDGSLLISTRVGHVNQVLPIVRYWIPFIKVVKPKRLQTQLVRQLSMYLQKVSGTC